MTNVRLLLVLLASTGFWASIIAVSGEMYLAHAVALNWFCAGLVLLIFWNNLYAGIAAAFVFLAVFVWPVIADRMKATDQREKIAALGTPVAAIDLQGKTVLFLFDRLPPYGCDSYCDAVVMNEMPSAVYVMTALEPWELEEGPVDLLAPPVRQALMENPNPNSVASRFRERYLAGRVDRMAWVEDTPIRLSDVTIDYVILVDMSMAVTKEALNTHLNGNLGENRAGYMEADYAMSIYASEDPRSFDIATEEPIAGHVCFERKTLRIPHNPIARFNYVGIVVKC